MALNISLNGSNYVSDKTSGAFERALQDTGSRTQETRIEKFVPVQGDQESNTPQPTPHNFQASTFDSQLLDSLDRALAQSYEHQTLAMRIHEQYLHNQSDYARIFSELMQQQGAIFADGVANGSAAPQQTQIAATVLETLSHSMARFHDLQEQTLDVHKQFLAHQSDYARATIQLLVNQQIGESASQRIGGSADRRVCEPASERVGEAPKRGNGNGHHPQETGSGKQELRIENQETRIENHESASQRVNESTPVTSSPRHLVTLSPSLPLPPSPPPQSLIPSLLAIVSDKTGYPADMLELDMDMEADLGIDSIKRVEILGALQDAHPDLPEVSTDVLAEMRTLRQIVEKMQEAGNSKLEARSLIQHPASSIEYPASSIEQPKKA